MQKLAILVVALAPPDRQLVFFQRDLELLPSKARDGQRDAQAIGLVLRPGHPLDIVGRVTLARALGDAIKRTLDIVEAEQERM